MYYKNMKYIKAILLSLFFLLSVTACNSSSTPKRSTENAAPYQPTTESKNHGYTDYEPTNPNEYAEKKTTSELEEEYYEVFGDKFLDHIDDEEYEAAEVYETYGCDDYDDGYDDYDE